MSLPLLKKYRKRLSELLAFAETKLDFMQRTGEAPASELSYGYAYIRELKADMPPLDKEIARLEKLCKKKAKS